MKPGNHSKPAVVCNSHFLDLPRGCAHTNNLVWTSTSYKSCRLTKKKEKKKGGEFRQTLKIPGAALTAVLSLCCASGFSCARLWHAIPPLPSPSPGLSQPRVHQGHDEAGLLPSLPRPGLGQTLLQLLQQRHEGLPGQPGWPGPGVAEPHR